MNSFSNFTKSHDRKLSTQGQVGLIGVIRGEFCESVVQILMIVPWYNVITTIWYTVM